MSVRQRAADLLYAMCDRSNAKQIVAEMLSYLETADYSIREEMVGLKINFILFPITFLSKCPLSSGEPQTDSEKANKRAVS